MQSMHNKFVYFHVCSASLSVRFSNLWLWCGCTAGLYVTCAQAANDLDREINARDAQKHLIFCDSGKWIETFGTVNCFFSQVDEPIFM